MSIMNHGHGVNQAGWSGIPERADVGRQEKQSAAVNFDNDCKRALDVQVGGGHYKNKAIQPVEYIHANNLNFLEGCIVKRITRWREKNGVQDLLKIKHEIDLLIELEERQGNKISGTGAAIR